MEGLPNEAVEGIVVLLCLSDVRNLRLTSRTLCSKVTQNHFKSFFRTKHVDIRQDSLTQFVEATQQPDSLCCQILEHVLLVGLVYDAHYLESEIAHLTENDRELDPERETILRQEIDAIKLQQDESSIFRSSSAGAQSLGAAFRNLARRCRPLISLELEVMVHFLSSTQQESPTLHKYNAPKPQVNTRGASSHLILEASTHTFRLATGSLASSHLQIQRLMLFTGHRMQRCSLPYFVLDETDVERDLSPVFQGVGSLSVSMSDPALKTLSSHYSLDGDPVELESHNPTRWTGIKRVLQSTPMLITLDLHYYKTTRQDLQRQGMLRSFASCGGSLPHLRTCHLRGVEFEMCDLMLFLRSLALHCLTIKEGFAHSGTWREFFDYIVLVDNIQRLFFDDLFETFRGRHVFFDDSGTQKYTNTATSGCNTLERVGETTKLPINYHFSTSRIRGTGSYHRWMKDRSLEYGP